MWGTSVTLMRNSSLRSKDNKYFAHIVSERKLQNEGGAEQITGTSLTPMEEDSPSGEGIESPWSVLEAAQMGTATVPTLQVLPLQAPPHG